MNTEKRLALAFVLSMAVILLFTWYKAPARNTRTMPSAARTTPTSVTTPSGEPTPAPEVVPVETAVQSAGEVSAPTGETRAILGWYWLPAQPPSSSSGEVVVESSFYRVRFSKNGGLPLSWQLLGFEELFADPRYLRLLIDGGVNPVNQIARFELDHLSSLKDHSSSTVEALNAAFAHGESGLILQWGRHHSDHDIPYTASVDQLKVDQPSDLRFTYTWGGLTLEKTYRFYPQSYKVDFQVRLLNQSGLPLVFEEGDGFYDVNWTGGFGFPSLRDDAINQAYLQLTGSHSALFVEKMESALRADPDTLLPEYNRLAMLVHTETVNWVGVGQKYFLAAIVPLGKSNRAIEGISNPDRDHLPVKKPLVGIRMAVKEIPDGASFADQFTLYIGPKDENQLQAAQAGLEEANQIFLRSFTQPIVHLMLRLLQGFYRIIPNYGVGIILLTLLVKALMFPLYHKQMMQMKKMQAIQPHLNALKEQLKNDPQKLQKEQMELFRKHKVNPLGGCLPMLPTIPIFIALYATFGMAVELRGAPFFAWIQDLSAPDRAFYIPLGGWIIPLNVLPLAYAVLMFWSMSQQKIEGPNAAMMRYFPLFFVFLFWSIASGVILYFVISILIDVIQRMVMEYMQKGQAAPLKPAKSG